MAGGDDSQGGDAGGESGERSFQQADERQRIGQVFCVSWCPQPGQHKVGESLVEIAHGVRFDRNRDRLHAALTEQRQACARVADMVFEPTHDMAAIGGADQTPAPSTRLGSSSAINAAKCASLPSCGVAVSSSIPSEIVARTRASR